MSVVLVCLPSAPKVSEEAVRKDAELNKYLESRVEGENGWMEKVVYCIQNEVVEYRKKFKRMFGHLT